MRKMSLLLALALALAAIFGVLAEDEIAAGPVEAEVEEIDAELYFDEAGNDIDAPETVSAAEYGGEAPYKLFIEDGVVKQYRTDGWDGLVVIPDGVTAIGSNSFGHTKVTGVSIPNSVNEIQPYAFSGCDDLTSITIPGNVKTIG